MSDGPTPGWYPTDDHTERYWDGNDWSERTRPRVAGPPPPASEPSESTKTPPGRSPLVTGLVLAAGVVGLIMAAQSVSLFSGTGTLWTGVAIGVGAVIVAFAVKVKVWVRILLLLAAAIGIANTIAAEVQLNDLRNSFGSQTSVSTEIE